MKFLAFAASHRPDSLNRHLVTLATKQIGSNVDIAEYGELDMPVYNDLESDNPPKAVLDLAKRLEQVNGVIIATPEYNWSVPGSLKNIIDWLSVLKPAPLTGKTALLMAASPGTRAMVSRAR